MKTLLWVGGQQGGRAWMASGGDRNGNARPKLRLGKDGPDPLPSLKDA